MAVGNVLETAGNHLKACIVLYFNQLLSGGKALNRRSVYFLSYLGDLFWGRGGLMVSALDSGASAPGSSPGRGHCVVFLGKTLHSHSLSTQVYKWVPANLMLGVTLRWTSIPSRGE